MGGHEREGLPGRSRSERRVDLRLCKDVLASPRGKTTLRTGHDCVFTWPGTLRLSPPSWRRPVAQPLPGDTQFAQTMPELGRQHRYMGAAPNPRILTGWFGASSHGFRFPVRAFLRFPVCPPGLFPFVRRPPVSLSSGVLRIRTFGRRCPVPFPVGFPPVSFPFSNLHASARRGPIRRHWSHPARTNVTRTSAIPGSDPPATQNVPQAQIE